jgi:hypothetical protein
MNAYERFLIRNRIWCERCSDLTTATQVEQVNGKDTVLCDWHASRLRAAKFSDQKQDKIQVCAAATPIDQRKQRDRLPQT